MEPRMEPRLLRYNLPYTLHLRKNKYYVSVNVPNEIKHLYPDGRKRVSSETNDKRVANERANSGCFGAIRVTLERLTLGFQNQAILRAIAAELDTVGMNYQNFNISNSQYIASYLWK